MLNEYQQESRFVRVYTVQYILIHLLPTVGRKKKKKTVKNNYYIGQGPSRKEEEKKNGLIIEADVRI